MVNAVVGAGFTNQFVEPLAYFVKPAPRAMPMQLDTIKAIANRLLKPQKPGF